MWQNDTIIIYYYDVYVKYIYIILLSEYSRHLSFYLPYYKYFKIYHRVSGADSKHFTHILVPTNLVISELNFSRPTEQTVCQSDILI